MTISKLRLILLVCFFSPSVQWYYEHGGPELWAKHYKDCGGLKQSPINLPSAARASTKANFPNFNRSLYTKIPEYIQLQLLEHTVLIKPYYENDSKVTVKGGPLIHTYILDHVHFHWSAGNVTTGSEHTINGKQYAMEAHVVHYCSKYKTVQDAMTQDDGVMVMGYLLKAHHNATFVTMDNLTDYFKYFTDTREINITKPFAFSRLLRPFQNKYVTYNGSMTTPPCVETVCWIVLDTPLRISETNLHRFWDLGNLNSSLKTNVRPLQQRNNRKIVGKKIVSLV